MRKLILLAAAGALALGFAASSPAQADDHPIVIGATIAQSNWLAVYDLPPIRGVEMAMDEVNAAGGVNGRMLELRIIDSKADPEKNAQAGLLLIDDGAEFLLTSCDYDQGAPAAIEANAADIPVFTLCAGDHKFGVDGIGPMAFTVTTNATEEGYIGADWAHEDRGWRTGYMLFNNTI